MLVDIYDLTVRYDEKRPSTDPKMNTDFVGL